jgi:hypothetical protein
VTPPPPQAYLSSLFHCKQTLALLHHYLKKTIDGEHFNRYIVPDNKQNYEIEFEFSSGRETEVVTITLN